jgi:hypothetical protein
MTMAEKTMGPREAQLRAMREANVEKNKKLIDKSVTKMKVKAIGKVSNVKAAKRGGRGR